MTQVDFYILKDDADGNRFLLACRVAEKARNAGHRVLIHTTSDDESRHMDQLLWTYNKSSFVPHGLLGDADPAQNPVLIGNAHSDHEEHDVLINLATEVPTVFSRFSRLAECVDNDEVVRTASRERYRFYRDRGYPLSVHELS